MSFFRNVCALAVIGIGACSFLSAAANASSLKDITAATYKLYDGAGEGYCSTTLIKNSDGKEGAIFLTAAHCADEKGMNVRVQHIDPKNLRDVLSEEVVYVKAVKTLKTKDIAVLQALDKNSQFSVGKTVDIATVDEANTLSVGDDLLILGYPSAEAKAVTKTLFTGKVPGIEELGWDKDSPVYQVTGGVAGGNSGGGLYAKFGDEWKLIGTTSAMRTDNAIQAYFQTAETVNEALRGYGVSIKVTPEPSPAAVKGSLNIDER